MKYREEKEKSQKYKREYLSGITRVIEERCAQAEKSRGEYIKGIFENPEKYRDDFKKMLGWPLVDCLNFEMPAPICEKLSDEDGYTIYRMTFEVLDGLKMTGLFFKLNTPDKKPLVIVQHGGLGTPELISGLYDGTGNYNDMLERTIKRGVHAFAPQLLLWEDGYDVPFDRLKIDAQLKRVGSSITAVEVFGIMRILDCFETQSFVSCFGMVGLSYGGFYTLYTAALDTRIKSALSCSFFNKRDKYSSWIDWTWNNSAYMFDDAEIAALVYPRRLCLEMGTRDDLFDYKYSIESFEKLKNICKDVGTDWVELKIFDGTHEFCTDDGPLDRLVADLGVI